ncbi:DUF4232 domain-containing protein [Pseudonocardia ailaonensis]|uniref:DUF4232 domain-containing protein n=1 Tax=Pseudonocardia ailaonensis TaxID=367279 RepID=A0ABN2MNY1_9PSEU
MRRTVLRGLVAAGAAVTALLAAGCSGGGDEVNGGTVTASASATAAPSATTGAAPVASTRPAAPTGTPSGTPPNCPTGSLRLTLGASDGAAGSVVRTLVFTNTGSTTCEMRGFPGVSYVAGDDGHQVGAAAVMDGARGGEVVLAPGASATAQTKAADAGNYDAATCRPTPVRGLRVYPPGETASLFLPLDTTGCAGDTGTSPQLSVQTMMPA